MMKLINVSGDNRVEAAIKYFMIQAPKIIESIGRLHINSKDFTYTIHSNSQVAMLLSDAFNSSVEIKVVVKKHWNPFSACIGWTDKKYPRTIFINARKIGSMGQYDIAGNIAHEFCHDPCGFGHGDNKVDGLKKLSVPYAFGYLISGESGFPLTKYRPHLVE
jgi:hypothetical protein